MAPSPPAVRSNRRCFSFDLAMSTKCVLILDTSLLCVWLRVPGMESCGKEGDLWDHTRVDKEIQSAIECGYTLVLPLATIIESGNHIAQAPEHRFDTARRLAEVIEKSADQKSPWAAFTDQSELWTAENLKRLAADWPKLASGKLAIGDATIKHVAEYYSKMGYEVWLFTADQQLLKFEPPLPLLIPRRRKDMTT